MSGAQVQADAAAAAAWISASELWGPQGALPDEAALAERLPGLPPAVLAALARAPRVQGSPEVLKAAAIAACMWSFPREDSAYSEAEQEEAELLSLDRVLALGDVVALAAEGIADGEEVEGILRSFASVGHMHFFAEDDIARPFTGSPGLCAAPPETREYVRALVLARSLEGHTPAGAATAEDIAFVRSRLDHARALAAAVQDRGTFSPDVLVPVLDHAASAVSDGVL